MSYHSKRFAFVALAIVGSSAIGIAAKITGIPSLYAAALLSLLAGWLAFSIMDARSAALSIDDPTPPPEPNDRPRAAMASRIACRIFAVVIPTGCALICILTALHSILALASTLLLALLACSYYFRWTDRLIDAWDRNASSRSEHPWRHG